MTTIGVVTVARSDYGIYFPLLRRIKEDSSLRLHIIASGMHLSPEFGFTVQTIEEDGFEVGERVEMLLSSDSPAGIAKSIGLGTIGFAQSYARYRPDILVVLGDRFEMLAAAIASLPFKIPLAHIHGGESTEGAIDDSIRNAISKMSHLHFVATETYGRRLVQMGEEPWRVTVSGSPSLDNLHLMELFDLQELEKQYGLHLEDPFLLVTFHPVTLEYEDTENQICELLSALAVVNATIVFTYPNADTCSRLIIQKIKEFAEKRTRAQVVVNLGTRGYFSVMKYAAAMVGNSSSGIIEAASFRLPVVNIGTRQRGRVRGKNVVDVGYRRSEIVEGIEQALSPEFGANLSTISNPYGDGHAAEVITDKLKQLNIDQKLFQKHFHEI